VRHLVSVRVFCVFLPSQINFDFLVLTCDLIPIRILGSCYLWLSLVLLFAASPFTDCFVTIFSSHKDHVKLFLVHLPLRVSILFP